MNWKHLTDWLTEFCGFIWTVVIFCFFLQAIGINPDRIFNVLSDSKVSQIKASILNIVSILLRYLLCSLYIYCIIAICTVYAVFAVFCIYLIYFIFRIFCIYCIYRIFSIKCIQCTNFLTVYTALNWSIENLESIVRILLVRTEFCRIAYTN